jgi:hypothetical protein
MARKKQKDDDGSDSIVREAHKRFERCQRAEKDFRDRFKEDVKFANGDSENGWQWDANMRKRRDDMGRPCLTINKVRQHCFQIINDAKQNKPSVKCLPIDGKADIQIAKILDGIVRHIEYNSHAEIAYDTATEFAVWGGIGYWRIVTEYAHDGSFDQEIFIRRVKNPLTVSIDPDIQSGDGADMKFAFVFEDMTREEFDASYPDAAGEGGPVVFPMDGNSGSEWLGNDRIRVCEYFRKTGKTDLLVAHPTLGPSLLSSLSPEDKAVIDADPNVKRRSVETPVIEWYKIAGNKVIDKKEWPGRYIPIVRVVGEEVDIDGEIERKGHTRNLKDPQRMYNFMSSAEAEFIALQTKTPYVGPVKAFQGFESYWASANHENRAYLPYNDRDEEGNEIARPQREQPPVGAQAYLTAMQTAQQELMMASGQYQETFGQQSNADAGVAIQARQRQGDKATYHFIDNVARAIRYTGRILVDLIPKVYDTRRVLRIVGEDGTEDFATIDGNLPHPIADQSGQPVQIDRNEKLTPEQAAQLIYNPGIGRYDVTVEVGPNYETRRQEAFHALSQIIGQNEELMGKAGDLLFKAADFPMAQDVAERLRRTIPPALLGEGPTPQEQDMQQKMQHMGEMIEHLTQQLQQAKQGKEQQDTDIKAYDAETRRFAALGQPIDPQVVAHVATQVVMDMMRTGSPEGDPPPDPMQQMQPQQMQPNPPSAGFSLPPQQ